MLEIVQLILNGFSCRWIKNYMKWKKNVFFLSFVTSVTTYEFFLFSITKFVTIAVVFGLCQISEIFFFKIGFWNADIFGLGEDRSCKRWMLAIKLYPLVYENRLDLMEIIRKWRVKTTYLRKIRFCSATSNGILLAGGRNNLNRTPEDVT